MRRPWSLLVLLTLASIACLGAADALVNASGSAASGVLVTFSHAVRITDYDRDVFPDVTPDGAAATFTFDGGSLPRSRSFAISWTPSWASIVAVEWKRGTTRGPGVSWLQSMLGSLQPSEMPSLQEWNDPTRLYYGALTLSTDRWVPMAACYSGFELSDWQIARLRGVLSENGVVFRIEFSAAGHPSRDPAVEYEISLAGFGAVLVRCEEEAAGIWTGKHRPEIRLTYYMVDRDSITVALTLQNLAAIGCTPQSLLGTQSRLGIKYREDKTHYFIYNNSSASSLAWSSAALQP